MPRDRPLDNPSQKHRSDPTCTWSRGSRILPITDLGLWLCLLGWYLDLPGLLGWYEGGKNNGGQGQMIDLDSATFCMGISHYATMPTCKV